jgi:beta-galactosidase
MPETQIFDLLLHEEARSPNYSHAMGGAYQGFFDNNVQADWVQLDQINEYQLLYLPYPVMMNEASAEKLKTWVRKGGTLISEGCPGYFGDQGRVGVRQPNYGMDQLFGAAEEQVEFMPDLFQDLSFGWNGSRIHGGVYKQTYQQENGRVTGRYPDGKPAVVESAYGEGKTLLIGTLPSEAYFRTRSSTNQGFFSEVMQWAGRTPHVRLSNRSIQARLSRSPSGDMALWMINAQKDSIETTVELSVTWGTWNADGVFWGDAASCKQEGSKLRVSIPASDAFVIRLTAEAGNKGGEAK